MPLVLWCAQRISHAPSQSRWYHNTLAKQGKCEMFICIIWNIFGTKKKRNATQQNKRREEKSESLIVAQPKFIALKWIIPNSETHTHTHWDWAHMNRQIYNVYFCFTIQFGSVRFCSSASQLNYMKCVRWIQWSDCKQASKPSIVGGCF